ncbi:MAG TPA: DUF4041 domain-containing protein [Acidimicrobiales bacterium]|nr:DUF4041 domain-containing protein [Acidimicrobiales bacterium]
MTTRAAPAGWYSNPNNPAAFLWWDGTRWAPPPPSAPLRPPEQAPAPIPGLPEPPTAAQTPAPVEPHHRLFGGKRELEEEVSRLNAVIAFYGVPERDALQREIAQLRVELPGLQAEQTALNSAVVPLRAEVATLGAEKQQLEALRAEVASLRSQRDALVAETTQLRELQSESAGLRAELTELQSQVVETRETAILQEVGVYEYRHPLTDAPAYKTQLAQLSDQIKAAVKAGTAVTGAQNWTVNGSAKEGARMVREFSKLMLRAYNNEADNAVRSMKPYALATSVARLTKAKETISKLGKTMSITVNEAYHVLRVTELELTADYLAKVAEQKERERAERARLREEEIAQREFERERERLRKEHAHYVEAAAQLHAKGDHEAAEQAEEKLTEIQGSIDGVDERAANIRAGHVYVISNVGAFGPEMVKIGLTRRLDPMDRVRELGDASVPFHYDLHAMVFSADAVTLETQLHQALGQWRVNLVNQRREFFRTTPTKVRDLILGYDASIITWVEEPEALEWRQSETTRRELRSTPGS